MQEGRGARARVGLALSALVASVVASVACGACGSEVGPGATSTGSGPGPDGADGGPTTTPSDAGGEHAVGGTVTGLSGNGLVLQDNGGDDLTIAADGSFQFATKLAKGAAYAVTVKTQPSAPAQTCSVAGGTGTVADADVTSVKVTCDTSGAWAWMGGTKSASDDGHGVYGTQGTAAPTNVPGVRQASCVAVGADGTAWLFGGYGQGETGFDSTLSDLWKYAGGQWTWVAGSKDTLAPGVYAGADAHPGARDLHACAVDAAGSFWVFGGAETNGQRNDLWKFDPATSKWTFVSGSANVSQAGTYGTKGTAAPANVPGARDDATMWVDGAGAVWLFGGDGYDKNGAGGSLADVWKYAGGAWTWIAGSDTIAAKGEYGTLGTPSATSTPGARKAFASWVDAKGHLWVFGGYGFDSAGTEGVLNDLWSFDPATGQWTWMSGSQVVGAFGTYGTKGTPAAGNVPSAREAAVGWSTSNGDAWLFGGEAYDVTHASGHSNELWKFSGGQWTWVGGSDHAAAKGVYGTLGQVDPASTPGARWRAAGFVDATDHLWVFGGQGTESTGLDGKRNDLWRFSP